MSDGASSWFPIVLLAVLAALTFWLDRVVQPKVGPRLDAMNNDPDYIVDGLSAVRMDQRGEVKHTLRARKMTHFPDADITILLDPRFMTYAEGRAPVIVTSRRARMSANGENVYFENDVRVVRSAHANQDELVLETNYLHVIPDANIAKSDQAVTLRNATAVVTASGLELNSETRVLRLQGRVKGVFERDNPALRHAR